ncbi:UNVERIFIED_CONTAM: type I restriction enzyme S subunit [Acidovorax defluvii]
MLLSNLDILATAPGGVARLRELILTLAVQGKLVPQDPADEPASVLLQKIRAEKDRLMAEGKIRRDKPLAAIADEEKPFALPVGWEWVRLGEITNYGTTTKVEKLQPDTWVLDMEDIERCSGRLLQRLRFAQRPALSDKNCFLAGDVLYGKLRPYLNKVFVADEDGVCTTEIIPFRCFGDYVPQYFRLVLSSPFFLEYVNARSYGMKMPRLGTEDARKSVFPLPPLAEQSRIVTRVEELMRLCDALEVKGQLQAAQHAQLVSTLLGTLTASTTPEELADHWQRVAQHFDLLAGRPEAIDALEQTLLQLAVRGLLVPQDPQDEPASALLQKIRTEKDRLIATGQIKQGKPLPPITDEEKPFELPVGWEWGRLEQLSIAIVDCPHSTPKFVESGRLCLDTNSFKQGVLLPHKLRFVDESTFVERNARLAPQPGDLVFAREGSVGESILIPDGVDACLGQRVMLFRFSTQVSKEFVRLAISSTSFLDALLAMHKGIGAKHVNVGDMRNAVIPLPPLPEQSRIVTRVTALRRLCADLRQRLAERQSVQARLAEALVANNAQTSTQQEDECHAA